MENNPPKYPRLTPWEQSKCPQKIPHKNGDFLMLLMGKNT
jgi:hypothetical protein